jgi:hypothetical protein
MRIRFSFSVCIISLLAFACNPTRVVQPIQKGQVQVGANFGGPTILLGSTPLPVPLTSIHTAYGLREQTTAFASLHTTALLYGVLQTDFGITHQLLAPNKFIPGISVSPIANLMFDTWEHKFSVYPQLDINAYWNYGTKKHLVYASLNNWFELRKTRAHDEPQTTHWLPSIGIGHQWNNKKYNIQCEIKYIAPTESNENIVVDYVSINTKGAIGLYVGINRKF